jgi:hypothetical protein
LSFLFLNRCHTLYSNFSIFFSFPVVAPGLHHHCTNESLWVRHVARIALLESSVCATTDTSACSTEHPFSARHRAKGLFVEQWTCGLSESKSFFTTW